MEELEINGSYVEKSNLLADNRGSFLKLFSQSKTQTVLPDFKAKEVYITSSHRNVVRGMHFQIPPHDHGKIVVCLAGAVTDVLLDLRSGRNYGAFTTLELNSDGNNIIYIPRGVAHGFLSKAETSILAYTVETEYSVEHDRGILWNSFGYDWGITNPILSQRDSVHPKFADGQRYF
jgi:dTDP-4-dehydrorhamnose 3,5-epimerase